MSVSETNKEISFESPDIPRHYSEYVYKGVPGQAVTFFKRWYFTSLNDDTEVMKVDKIGIHNTLPTGWDDSIASMKVNKGYNICLYDQPFLKMSSSEIPPYCAGEGDYLDFKKITASPGINWHKKVKSFQIKKVCDDPQWMWDTDCMFGNKDRVLSHCDDKESACHRNRIIHCNTSDQPNDKCIEFCNQNHGECDIMMQKYCDIEENKDKDICKCLNSPASDHNPLCIDGDCVRLGYATASMKGQQCADNIDCKIYHQLKESGNNVSFTDASVEYRCNPGKTDAEPPLTDQQLENNIKRNNSFKGLIQADVTHTTTINNDVSLAELHRKQQQKNEQKQEQEQEQEQGRGWIVNTVIVLIVLLLIGIVMYFVGSSLGWFGSSVSTSTQLAS